MRMVIRDCERICDTAVISFWSKHQEKKLLTEIREIGCRVFLSTYQPNPVLRMIEQAQIRRISVCSLKVTTQETKFTQDARFKISYQQERL